MDLGNLEDLTHLRRKFQSLLKIVEEQASNITNTLIHTPLQGSGGGAVNISQLLT